jgi:Tol biopolymer transport system component
MLSRPTRGQRSRRLVAGLLFFSAAFRSADAQQTTRVSVDATGAQSNGLSQNPRISADGRFVVFESLASNLVAGDGNGTFDVFVQELATGAVERVSVSSAGIEGDDASQQPAISADGRFVVFESLASNLVAGDGNGASDVFLRDRQAGTTVRVNLSSAGVEANLQSHHASVSSDGRYVAFDSAATNLSSQDSNGVDVFRRDTSAGVTILVSLASSGAAALGSSSRATISADGNRIAFESNAGNLTSDDDNGTTDVFVRDVNAGTTTCVSVDPAGDPGDFGGWNAAISGDGTAVAFISTSTDLVANDTNNVADVFVRDLAGGTTERVSVATGGGEANGRCDDPSISADATRVGFASEADDLVAGDANGTWDVYLHDR